MAKNVSITWTFGEDGEATMDIVGMEGAACKPFHEDVSRDLGPLLEEVAVTDKPEMKSGMQRVAVNPITAARVTT